MRILFDGDILVFRCGFAAEKNHWFLTVGEESFEFDYKKDAVAKLDELLPGIRTREEGRDYALWSERVVEPVAHALHLVNQTITETLRVLEASEYDLTVFLSGEGNYRYKVATTRPYKGNRDQAHRPTHEHAIKDFIRSRFNTVVSDGEEADDAMGIAQTRIGPLESVIVTLDKDLDMIPGLKYNFVNRVPYSITEDQGHYNFCKQLLTGDSTDNIPGLPKIGHAKAAKLLENIPQEDMMLEVALAYMRHAPKDDWLEYLREQGQLLWIRQQPNEMWEPDEDVMALGSTEDYYDERANEESLRELF